MRRQTPSGRFWPSDEQRELLTVALGEPAEAVAAWKRLVPTFDLDEHEPGSFDLLALVYRQLTDSGYHDPVVERLKGVYRREWVRASVLRRLTTEVAAGLREAGVRALFVEGAALADRYFSTPSLRPSWSVDVFVEATDASAARTVLEAAGWSLAPWSLNTGPEGPWGFVSRERSVCSLRTSFSRDVVTSPRLQGPYEALWETARPYDLDGTEIGVPDPLWALLSVCVGGARLRTTTSPQWIVDAVMILRGGEVDFARLVAAAAALGQTVRLRAALDYVASLPGADIPEGALTGLAAFPSPRRERLAYALAGGSFRSAGSLPVLVADHIAGTTDRRLANVLWSFPDHLRREWGLRHAWVLPIEVGRRAVRLARAPKRVA